YSSGGDSVSNIFRQLRGSQSLRSFVKPLGITAQTWNLWERNISSPSMKVSKFFLFRFAA
ncbi:MAG: hypothetical protein IJ728_06190, partial [Selenomonadaceae bacterium]|nr:hypothetical protein [Selenomonadaceae bacterium]